MNSSFSMALRQKVGAEEANYWMAFPMSSTSMDTVSFPKAKNDYTLASVDDAPVKARKAYTITKQRERWTEDEHQKFLDALKLHGRAWRRIEEHIGTKTAVQIRSHAQKFFSKLEKEASSGGSLATDGSGEIEIPPPRPKRKPSHPYPKKEALSALLNSASCEDSKSPTAVYSAYTLKTSSGTTKLNILPKKVEKAGSPAASLRLFGQTVVQGIDTDNELIESTGSPRSQVSIGMEETSRTSPVVSNTASNTWDYSTLPSSKPNEQAIVENKSQLFNAISSYVPDAIAGQHLTHPTTAFWQGFGPWSFAHATNDDSNTAAAIATATFAAASAWQALHGALISNANNNFNTSIVYSPTPILAATRNSISDSTPWFPHHEQPKQEQWGPHIECEIDSGGTTPHLEESTAECCSSLTDSSRLSSVGSSSSDEDVPAKKHQRKFFGDGICLHNKLPEYLQSSIQHESAWNLDTRSSPSEDPGNLHQSTVNAAIGSSKTYKMQSWTDELIQPIEDDRQTTVMNIERPRNLINEACGLNLQSEMEEGRGVLKANHDSDKDIMSSSSACDKVRMSSTLSKQCLEGFSNTKLQVFIELQCDGDGTHVKPGEHLFMFKAGATSSRYSGVGFVPYKKCNNSDSS